MAHNASSDAASIDANPIDVRIAKRIKALRAQRNWSLEALATRSGISRATLSRIENAEVSATARTLDALSGRLGVTLTELLRSAEQEAPEKLTAAEQMVWRDPEGGFERRMVSPPTPETPGEVLTVRLTPGRRVAYAAPSQPGRAHHLWMLDGALMLQVDGRRHDLSTGDSLRYRLRGESCFEAGAETGARYALFLP